VGPDVLEHERDHERRFRDPFAHADVEPSLEIPPKESLEVTVVVVDHVAGRVVWAHPGKNAETLKAFFDELGAERCAKLEAVTIDMSAAYIKAVTEASPQAQIIFDRFHVQRLAHDALDEVRRAEVNQAATEAEQHGLKHTRWALQKNPWNLSGVERDRLSALPKVNRRLFRAYLLKEALAAVLDHKQVHVAGRKLKVDNATDACAHDREAELLQRRLHGLALRVEDPGLRPHEHGRSHSTTLGSSR